LDTTHATNLVESTKQIKDLIKENLFKNTDMIKKIGEKMQTQFMKIQKTFAEKMKATDKAYDVLVSNFEHNEDNFRNGEGSQLEKDLWFTQYTYLKRSKETIDSLNELKEVLFLSWDHGKDKEHSRMTALKALYDGILTNCNAIFG
jgi:tRNA U34 5-carboxymethylaminomethyl modifying enzyme MnmG/GidA